MEDHDVRQRVAAVESLLERVESLPEEPRAVALDAVRVLVELYGEALRRLLVAADGAATGPLARRAAGDELLSHLLVLHGLYPAELPAPPIEPFDPPARTPADDGGGFVPLSDLRGGRSSGRAGEPAG